MFLIYPVASSLDQQVQLPFTVPTFRGLGNFQDYSWVQPQYVFCGLQYKNNDVSFLLGREYTLLISGSH